MAMNPVEVHTQTQDPMNIPAYPIELKPCENNHRGKNIAGPYVPVRPDEAPRGGDSSLNHVNGPRLGSTSRAEVPNCVITIDSPPSEDQATVAESSNTSVSRAGSTSQTQDQDWYGCRVPIPGSKQNKQMYPKAPVALKCWGQGEYQTRFEFVKGELQGMVNRDTMLRDVAQRISYELRMVGTSPEEVFPSIVIRCRCDPKHVRALQSLFNGRTQEMLHSGKGFFLSRSRLEGPIPPLKLVFFKEKSGPVIRFGSDDSLQAAFDNTFTYCGGLARYQTSLATLGVSIQVGDMTAHLTVDHLFASSLGSGSDSATSLENTFRAEPDRAQLGDDGASDSEVYWENDDDEYDYGDDLDEQTEEDSDCWVSSTTSPTLPASSSKYFEQWEEVTPPVNLDPSMAYLDWSLARPVSSELGIPHTNIFFLNGSGLISGECGSMVVDHETDEIYGHVVGCNTSGHALIVPLNHVFSQVKHSFGAPHVGLTLSSMDMAMRLAKQGKHEIGEVLFRHALKIREQGIGLDHRDALGRMSGIAIVLYQQGKYDEAELMERCVADLQEKELGSEHPDTLNSMSNLAVVLNRQGRYSEAESMHRQALELRQKVLGRDHPDTLVNMNNLGSVLVSQGKHGEAEWLLLQTIQFQQKVLGPQHPDTLSSRSNLAMAAHAQGTYGDAERETREILAVQEAALGREHPDTLTSMNNLGVMLGEQGRYYEASNILQEGLALHEKVLGSNHPDTITTRDNMAICVEKSQHNIIGQRGVRTLGPTGGKGAD
ncbi:hypothetical protein ACJ41O_010805 [Fusarium nematophilum]